MEVIQKIQRENAGEYSCAASNQIGKNHSKSLHLDIKCKSNLSCSLSCLTSDPPTCRSKTHLLYTVKINTSVELHCNMAANPADDIKFRSLLRS